MKKWISLFLILTTGFLFCAPSAAAPIAGAPSAPSVSAKSAILINGDTGDVYWEKNADEPMGMASTTKLMTALVITELLTPETVISIPEEAVGVEGSSIYLVAGERLTVYQLLCALLLSSANDAATALAIAADGSEEAFSRRMNQKAYALGLKNTRFTNPHGLYDEDHYTTARELSILGAEVLRQPLLRSIVSTYKMTIPHDSVPDQRLLINHNKLLRTYEGAIGMKTGFTKKTGRTLVSAAERNGMTLICVTLNAPDDWRDHRAMLDYGFACYEKVIFASAGAFSFQLPITGGEKESVTLTNVRELSLYLPKIRPSHRYTVEGTGHFRFAPIEAGDALGRVLVECSGQTVTSVLIAAEAVPAKTPRRKTLWERLLSFFTT